MDSQLRDRMRSSASHNTLTLDGRSQSTPAGPFHWRSTVDARVIAHHTNDAFDWIEAAHDGYAPARHRRTIVRTPDWGWLIVDGITGTQSHHSAALHWHFDPAWNVGKRDHGSAIGDRHDGVRARHADGQTAWMLFAGGDMTLARGDDATGGGWCAPVYGQLEPTCTVRVTADGRAPFGLVTWVGSGRLFKSPRLRCMQTHDSGENAVVVEIIDEGRTAVFMVRSADAAHAEPLFRVGASKRTPRFFTSQRTTDISNR
jgi:hypothetical protein